MVRGLYIAGQGMLLQRRRMETITHNIANADTTGFKKDHFISHSFDDVLVRRINDHGVSRRPPGSPQGTPPVGTPDVPPGTPSMAAAWGGAARVGPMRLGVQVDHLYTDFTIGNLQNTERPTDLALIGDAFFVVQTADGERYTKAGAFYLDSAGYLVDGSGNFVLGENGPINVGGLNFSVDQQGNVWNDGGLVDTLRIVSFEDNTTLRREGFNLFFATVPPLAEPHEFTVAQGFLEMSNVDIGREMVEMIAMFRTYETNQRILSMIDETVGRAVNEIGRLR